MVVCNSEALKRNQTITSKRRCNKHHHSLSILILTNMFNQGILSIQQKKLLLLGPESAKR